MKGHSESAYFAKLVLQTEWFTLLWQRSRTQSIGPNDSNEKVCRVLFRINIAAITENTWPWPLTFDLDLFPWPLTLTSLTLRLNLLLPWFWRKYYQKMYVLTSRDAKTARQSYERNHFPIGISSRNILQPTRSLYDFRFQSYGSKWWFSWFVDVFDLDLDISRSFDFCEFTISSCMTGVNFEAICSLLAEI